MQKVTKNQFIQVLHRYTESSFDDAQNIIALKKTYPYSQVLHALAARLSKDHKLTTQQRELELAAVYASDRAVLKEVMTQQPTWPRSIETTRPDHAEHPESIAIASYDHHDEDLAEEVIHDLEKLNTLRHNFEMMFVDVDENNLTPSSAQEDSPTTSSEAYPQEPEQPVKSTVQVTTPEVQDDDDYYEDDEEEEDEEDEDDNALTHDAASENEENTENTTSNQKVTRPKASKRKSKKTKAQRIVELAKKLQAEDPDPEPLSEVVKKKEDNVDIIGEIKSSKKKISPENDKQREQLEIIDQFIKEQPVITSAKDKPSVTAHGDMSPVKSGEFGDNVISETLVKILVNQGKKDKAIEVLKKLIWKFPQKKGYFAAQIEDLKK